MKYCYKCGNQMDDDMLFCQKCGTKVIDQSPADPNMRPNGKGRAYSEERYSQDTEPIDSVAPPVTQTTADSHPKSQLRKGMKTFMIISLAFACFFAFIGLITGQTDMAVGTGGMFCIITLMFLVLSKSPKDAQYILGKNSGIKKTPFVILSIIIAFAIVGISAGTGNQTTTKEENSTKGVSESTTTNKPTPDLEVSSEPTSESPEISLLEIQKWYEDQIPGVSQDLVEYANSVDGISNFNIKESKFFFGENMGWVDCSYTFYFDCKVNGEKCIGEARSFRKYQEEEINWFHFEISKDVDWSTIVETYDESYDQIIEDYYNELYEKYK